MKNLIILFLLTASACSPHADLSPGKTVELVAESFYKADNETLKKYTTESSYNSLKAVQPLFKQDKEAETNFDVKNKMIDNDTAWVQFTTAFEEKTNTFKLVKVDGMWKVDNKKLSDKVPF